MWAGRRTRQDATRKGQGRGQLDWLGDTFMFSIGRKGPRLQKGLLCLPGRLSVCNIGRSHGPYYHGRLDGWMPTREGCFEIGIVDVTAFLALIEIHSFNHRFDVPPVSILFALLFKMSMKFKKVLIFIHSTRHPAWTACMMQQKQVHAPVSPKTL